MKRLALWLLAVLLATPLYAGTRDIREDTAGTYIIGPFEDSTGAPLTALTVASIDVTAYKNDGTAVTITPAASGSSNDMVHVDDGYYSFELTATDSSTPGYLRLTFQITGSLIFHEDFNVLPVNIYDSKYSTDKLEVDVTQFLGSAATATGGRPEVNSTHWGGTAVASALVRGNVIQWTGTNVATPATNGYPVVTLKIGTGAGEINLSSGTVPANVIAMTPSPTSLPGIECWHEIGLGGLFQDSTGTTTPAVADGDPIGYVPDRSGNGNHLTQATAGNRPLLRPTGVGGAPSGQLDGLGDNWTMGITVGNSKANGTWTRTYVIQPTEIIADGFYILAHKAGPVLDVVQGAETLSPSGATVGNRINRDHYSGSTGIGPGTVAINTPYFVVVQQKMVYLGNGTTASNTMRVMHERIWINGALVSDQYQTLTAWSTSTEWTIGGFGASFPFKGHIAFHAVYSGEITEGQLNVLGTYITKRFAISVGDHRPPPRDGLQVALVSVGDSLTKGIGAAGHPFPLVAARELADKFVATPINLGVSGLTTDSSDTNLRALMVPGENIASVFLGTNSIGSGISAATTYSQLQNKCTEIRALGYKVVVFTIPDRAAGFSGGVDTASFEVARQALNTSIRTNWATFADALIDCGSDQIQTINGNAYNWAVLGGASAAANDGIYFTDFTHLAISSHYLLGRAFADTVDVLVGDVSNFANRLAITQLPTVALEDTLNVARNDIIGEISSTQVDVDNVLTAVNAIPTVTSTAHMTITGPPILTVPRSGSAVARYKIFTFNGDGALEDPVTNTVNVTCTDPNGGTPPTVPATATRTAPGEYYVDVPIASTASKNQRLNITATGAVDSATVIDSTGVQLMPVPATSISTQ